MIMVWFHERRQQPWQRTKNNNKNYGIYAEHLNCTELKTLEREIPKHKSLHPPVTFQQLTLHRQIIIIIQYIRMSFKATPSRTTTAAGGGGTCAIPPKQFATVMESLCPNHTFTAGAMEALRQSHSRFLQLIASELASVWDTTNGHDNTRTTNNNNNYEDDHANFGITANQDTMEQCLERLGMDDLCTNVKKKIAEEKESCKKQQESSSRRKRKQSSTTAEGTNSDHNNSKATDTKKKVGRKKKKQKFQITEEMMAEQERLLGLSKKNMEASHHQPQDY